jgi:hypothetical protein
LVVAGASSLEEACSVEGRLVDHLEEHLEDPLEDRLEATRSGAAFLRMVEAATPAIRVEARIVLGVA